MAETNHFKLQTPFKNHVRYWLPKDELRAIVVIVHGLAEHGGRYDKLALKLLAAGFACFAIDHYGHGLSQGGRTELNHFDDYVSPVVTLLKVVRSYYPANPVYLVGHSMGGLISVSVLLKDQSLVDACVLSGPALYVMDGIKSPQLFILKTLSKFLPRMGVLQLDPTGVNSDPVKVQEYLDDPLVFSGKMTARCAGELIRQIDFVRSKYQYITLPLLLLHGGEDPMANPEGSRLLFANARSRVKELVIFDGLYHEIFHEKNNNEIFQRIINWFEILN